jgi:HEAT repeat protein
MSGEMSALSTPKERMEAAQRDPRSTQELIALSLRVDEDDIAGVDARSVLRDRGTREVFDAACALCEGQNSKERVLGADILNQFGAGQGIFSEESLAVLVRLLNRETDPEVLEAAACALGAFGLAGAVPPLLSLKEHRSPRVRRAVANALCCYTDPIAVQALIELTSDQNEVVRDWATFDLGSLLEADSPQVRDALAARLGDSDGVTRAEAIFGLASRRDERVFPALVEALHPARLASHAPRQDLLFDAVEELSDPRLIPALLRLSGHLDKKDLDDLVDRCRREAGA